MLLLLSLTDLNQDIKLFQINEDIDMRERLRLCTMSDVEKTDTSLILQADTDGDGVTDWANKWREANIKVNPMFVVGREC